MINLGMTSMTLKAWMPNEIIHFAKAHALYGIEWGNCAGHVPAGDVKRAQQIGQETREHGLAVLAYATYYEVGDPMEAFLEDLACANALQAPAMRIWTPRRSPWEVADAEFENICSQARLLAETAEKAHVKLLFEYHFDTLTETGDSAVCLMQHIGHANTGLYWQPDGGLSTQQNLLALQQVLPYVTKNIHMINYQKGGEFEELGPIRDAILSYLKELKQANRDFNVIIEFAKDNKPDNLVKSVTLLKALLHAVEMGAEHERF